ncbi:MAG TPA: hypothetical protein VEJ87_01940 [Acidimicrobiales bacterium]|nr:hypothetical protein [Acidimicrobiales bacterium]
MRRLVMTVALVATTTVGAIGGAMLFTTGGASATKSYCHLWAVVDNNAEVVNSGCGTSITVASAGSSSYNVTFPRNISTCAIEVTAANQGIASFDRFNNYVTVYTFDINAVYVEAAPMPFSIVLTCAGGGA